MSQTVELLGGPLDGHRTPMPVLVSFVWIDVRKGHIRYRRPGRYRVLYRREKTRLYIFAGNTHALCGGCEAVVERVDGHVGECSLCGGALIA